MVRRSSLYFYPARVGWIGAAVLGSVFLLILPFIFDSKPAVVNLIEHNEQKVLSTPFSFSLGLSEKAPLFPIPDLQGEITFSSDPPRPCEGIAGQRLLIRINKSGESKRVALPCRLDLELLRDTLVFAKDKSPFWIELSIAGNGQIEGKGYIASVEGEKIDTGTFYVTAQEAPLRMAQEFAEGSPFRFLSEARWWGRDQFREQYATAGFAERLEIGTEVLEIHEGDWLVWKDRGWQKSSTAEKDHLVAHIQSNTAKSLIFEGWDLEGYIRISISPAVAAPFKMRGEDLFSCIRIRSEKQISCTLEKQCMVLKTGDWVLKSGGRWKILRKASARAAYLNGKMFGELFVFEQIHSQRGQKMIRGRLFNQSRTQAVDIEMAAQSTGKQPRKGKPL